MIMMPYGWTLDIAAAHGSGRLLAPHTLSTRPNVRGRDADTNDGVECDAAHNGSPPVPSIKR
jgi:hypothetical protein